MAIPVQSSEVVAARFNRLVQGLLNGQLNRNCFYPWEVQLLLDIEACELPGTSKRQVLRHYVRAVNRTFERGAAAPMTLSEYLDIRKRKKVTMIS